MLSQSQKSKDIILSSCFVNISHNVLPVNKISGDHSINNPGNNHAISSSYWQFS